MTESAGPALKRLYEEFRDRVNFVTLYVREAHPGDRFPQPDTFERKMGHARAYQQRDRIPWTIVVDDVEGTLHRALDRKPHSAYLVDANGIVVGRLLWANEFGRLRAALEALTAGRRLGDVENKVVPMVRGLGKIDEVLSQSGGYARTDFRREVPPMYAMARLAGLFRPLPPLGRGVAAVATSLAAVALVVLAVRAAVRGLS
jgi:hypothetical protein